MVLVVFVFLQNWRATLIPMLAVPVSLIGTFVGLLLLGFSINTLTLFGMVLAIGIVVDDAIVVLENVERIMHEQHMPPREATLQGDGRGHRPGDRDRAGAVRRVHVRSPSSAASTGELYRQFAVTIAISVVISALVALTLTPALCALLLKAENQHEPGRFFRTFNRGFAGVTRDYQGGVNFLMRRALLALAILAW